jgi:hypothetical protein
MYIKSTIKKLLLKENVHLRMRIVAFVLLLVWTFMPIVMFPNNPERFSNCILGGPLMMFFFIPGMELFPGILLILYILAILITQYLNNSIVDMMSIYHLIQAALPLISGIIIIAAWKIKKSQTNS